MGGAGRGGALRGTDVNAFVFACLSAAVQEKCAFFSSSPSIKLFNSLIMVCLNTAGLHLSILSFRKCVRVYNFPKRTNCRSLLLSVSFSYPGSTFPSCLSIPLPARIFLTTQYTVAGGMAVHFEISVGLSISSLNFSELTSRF